jgi:integrase
MGYAKLPAFLAQLRAMEPTFASLALEILIFSGSRGGTVRKATWIEVDLKNFIWTRPPENLKQRAGNLHPHAVHITPRMATIFRFLHSIRSDDGLIFPGRGGAHLAPKCFGNLLPGGVDPHGLRTDLEVWRQEQTTFSTDVGAVQLDHAIRASEHDLIAAPIATRAYARSPLFNKRKSMMIAWDKFLMSAGDAPPLIGLDNASSTKK